MKHKLFIEIVFLSILLVLSINLVYSAGVTGAIGNGITVIPRQNVEEGKEVIIDRELIVINKNDFKVNITLESSSEIKDIIQLIDKNFQLEANQEKRAKFKIILNDNNEHSGKIAVYFQPEEGNGISIVSSKLTILGDEAENEEDNNVEDSSENEISEESDNENSQENDGNVSVKIGGGIKKDSGYSNFNFGWIIFFVILIAVIGAIVGFVVLIRK